MPKAQGVATGGGYIIGGIVGAIVIAILLTAFPPSAHRSIDPEPPSPSADNKDGQDKSSKTLWQKTFEDPVAFYTLVLTAFTGVLSIASIFQSRMLIKADETTRIAANAAKKSAEVAEIALVGLERPYLIAKMDLDIFGTKNGMLRCRINYGVYNIGRTPAAVKGVRIRSFVDERIDVGFQQSEPFNQDGIVYVAANTEEKLPSYTHSEFLPARFFENDQSSNNKLYFVLEVIYNDLRGKSYLYGFGGRVVAYNNRVGFTTESCEQYNFHREL